MNNKMKTVGMIVLMVFFVACIVMFFSDNRELNRSGVILTVQLVFIVAIFLVILLIDQKVRRNVLKFQNARMELMLSMSPGLLVENLDERNEVNIEGSTAQVFGLPTGRMEKEEFLKVIHPSDFIRYIIAYGKIADGTIEGTDAVREEIRLRTEDGSYIWVECFFYTILATDGNQHIISAFYDIDKRKRESQEKVNIIQSLSNQYSTLMLVDLINDRYEVLKDERGLERRIPETGSYSRVNKIFFGIRASADLRETVTGQLAIDTIRNQLSLTVPVMEVEYKRNLDKNREKWERITIVKVSEAEGKVSEVILGINDVTEQKKVEIANRQMMQEALDTAKSANNAKSDFLSKMSHDIRTPLNAIIGMSAIAQKNLNDSGRIQDCLDKIGTSGNHLLNLVNEVLDMSRIESGRISLYEEECSLEELIQSVRFIVENLAAEREHTFTVDVRGLVNPQVIADSSRIQQVLTNLLSNAVKYTPPGGRIGLTVRDIPDMLLDICAYEFVIEDNGVGMAPEYLEEIYEPFSRVDDSRTSKIEGTGLGMAIVQNLVRLMNGTIRIESKIGIGTKFVVTLPLKQQEDKGERIKKQERPLQTNFSGKRVLMVEDNELNMEIAVDLLSAANVMVETAENGLEAVEKVIHAKENYYDLVFMDVQMPIMNGYEASRRIRELNRKDALTLPIIAITANAFAEDVVKAKEAGMNDHVAKPMGFDQLLAVMNAWMGTGEDR